MKMKVKPVINIKELEKKTEQYDFDDEKVQCDHCCTFSDTTDTNSKILRQRFSYNSCVIERLPLIQYVLKGFLQPICNFERNLI